MNRKGIELPLNFIVTIAIALAILFFGIRFVYNIYEGANELEDMTFTTLDEKVGNLLCDTSEKTCIGIESREVRKGDLGYFALKIINVADISAFTVTVSKGNAYDKDKVLIIDNRLDYLPTRSRTLTIPNNEEYTMAIGVHVPKNAISGTYLFNVKIDADGTPYGSPYQLIVKVP